MESRKPRRLKIKNQHHDPQAKLLTTTAIRAENTTFTTSCSSPSQGSGFRHRLSRAKQDRSNAFRKALITASIMPNSDKKHKDLIRQLSFQMNSLNIERVYYFKLDSESGEWVRTQTFIVHKDPTPETQELGVF